MSNQATRLAEDAKRLAEDMADKACATEAGEFVAKERARLHAAIDALLALVQPAVSEEAPTDSLKDSLRLDWCERHAVGIENLGSAGWQVFGDDCAEGFTLREAIDRAAFHTPLARAQSSKGDEALGEQHE